MSSNPIDENGNFAFFDDEDDQIFKRSAISPNEQINLMET